MSNFFAAIDARSIALFIEKSPDGNRALGGGCFFIHRDIILTAKHVLSEAIADQKPLFVVNGSNDNKLITARPLHFYAHPEIDLALVQVSTDGLQIEHPLYPSHFALHEATGSVGVGYDRTRSNNAANSWVILAHQIAKLEPEKRERKSGSIEYSLEFDAPWMEPGCSGGPVLTAGGGVAAVLIESFATANQTTDTSEKSSGRATSVYPMVEAFRSPFQYLDHTPIRAAEP